MKDTNTRIYVANLGKYNEGYLVGEWLDLPTTEEEFNAFLKCHVGINEQYEEWAIHDYETDLPLHISEYENVLQLSELIEQAERGDTDKIAAILEVEGCSLQEAVDSVDNYGLYSDVNDDEELGRACLLESGCYDIPEYLTDYIDYEAWGRDIRESEGGDFTKYGYTYRC